MVPESECLGLAGHSGQASGDGDFTLESPERHC